METRGCTYRLIGHRKTENNFVILELLWSTIHVITKSLQSEKWIGNTVAWKISRSIKQRIETNFQYTCVVSVRRTNLGWSLVTGILDLEWYSRSEPVTGYPLPTALLCYALPLFGWWSFWPFNESGRFQVRFMLTKMANPKWIVMINYGKRRSASKNEFFSLLYLPSS